MEIARRTTEEAIESISTVAKETAASSALQRASEQMKEWAVKLQQAIEKFTVE